MKPVALSESVNAVNDGADYRGSWARATRVRSGCLRTGQGVVHDSPRFGDNAVQMGLVLEALGVDFVDVFGAGRTGRKPATCRHNFQTPDRSVVARSAGQLGGDRLPGQLRLLDSFGRQFLQP